MKYILRKLIYLFLTAWSALTIDFILPRLMPGNPAQIMIAKYKGTLGPQALQSLETAFGINVHQNIFLQYFSYLYRTVTGNFGISLTYYPSTVMSMISGAIPWTIGLVGVSTIIAFVLGTLIGINSAWKRESFISNISVPISIFFNSMPYFWFALLLEYFVAYLLGWFPLTGAFSAQMSGFAFISSVLYHAILPATTIIVTAFGGWILTMRNNMINVLSEDYIAFAFSQGLPEREIEFNYVARNAILPNFTGFAMAIGFVISGVLLVEMVFSYPGIGYLLYQAVIDLDYPLMNAIFLFIIIAVLIANFIADMIYVLLDPRIRGE
uniref:ABC transporter permease n=1 Tax=Thermodesulfobium narugense TaxID=184064 RepID=A0A7C5PH43_9BACT